MQKALSHPNPRQVSRELSERNCDLRSRKQSYKEAEGKIPLCPFPLLILSVLTIVLTQSVQGRIQFGGVVPTGQTPGHGAI